MEYALFDGDKCGGGIQLCPLKSPAYLDTWWQARFPVAIDSRLS
jgi:hypothetical protein